jgi:lipoate---protein ligase
VHVLDLTLPTLAENVALDEALLLDAEAGGPEVLRFWEWPTPGVVVGAAGRLTEDVDVGVCNRAKVPLVRRASGGGTVLLGAGCLLFSLVLRFNRDPALGDLHASYRWILGRTQRALEQIAAPIQILGTSDLALGDRKFSGNAQQRKRTHLLHHGSLLYAFDISSVERYLMQPSRQPEYRRDRAHAEFLTNLPARPDWLRAALRDVWQAMEFLNAWPEATMKQLIAEKYNRSEWTHRR